MTDRLCSHHEAWKVEIPFVRRYIRTFHVTQLALIALVDDLILFDGRHR